MSSPRSGDSTSKATSVKVGNQLSSSRFYWMSLCFCVPSREIDSRHAHTDICPLIEKPPPRVEWMPSPWELQQICSSLNGYPRAELPLLTLGWAPSAETTEAHIAQLFFSPAGPWQNSWLNSVTYMTPRRLSHGCAKQVSRVKLAWNQHLIGWGWLQSEKQMK